MADAFSLASASLQAWYFPEDGGQAALQPDPDAFPAEVVPRSAATMACERARLLKRSGKSKPTGADGL
jgi:hypothetical protein